MLHNDKDLFERAVLDTFEKYGIVPVIIEKDYYVTLFLREIVKRQPKIIFKVLPSYQPLFRRYRSEYEILFAGDCGYGYLQKGFRIHHDPLDI